MTTEEPHIETDILAVYFEQTLGVYKKLGQPDQLNEDEIRGIGEHLSDCASCKEEAVDIRVTTNTMARTLGL